MAVPVASLAGGERLDHGPLAQGGRAGPEQGAVSDRFPQPPDPACETPNAEQVPRFSPLERALLLLSLLVYTAMVLWRLEAFPLYFFADEAVEGVDAYAVATTGADHRGKRWPLFFEGLGEYPLSLTVYLHVPLIAAAGLSVATVRATTALVSLIGVLALTFFLRDTLARSAAWLTPLALAVSPIWYLHSRTGFEYIPAASFYLLFLYLLHRATTSRATAVPFAAMAAAAAFYSYTPARGWVLLAATLSTLLLAPTHYRLWRRWVGFVALLGVLLIPYVVLHVAHPEVALHRLESAGFADFRYLPLLGKARHVAVNVLEVVDPRFWFSWEHTPHDGSMQRHVIPELALVPWWLAPFSLLGALVALRRICTAGSRLLFAFLLVVPLPAAVLAITNHRCLPLGPLYLALALVGLAALLDRVQRFRAARVTLPILLFLGFAGYALSFQHHVFRSAPRRYADYGFYGLQVGAPELFGWLASHHQPYGSVLLDTGLFNAGHVFTRFFLSGEALEKTRMVAAGDICRGKMVWPPGDTLFAVPAAFAETVRTSGCPLRLRRVHSVLDPLGRDVIDLVSVETGPDFAEWLQAETLLHRQPRTTELEVGGRHVTLEHPLFDMGSAAELLDGRPETIVRTAQVNPARLTVRFDAPRPIHEVVVTFANTTEADVEVATTGPWDSPVWGKRHYSRARGDPLDLHFTRAQPIVASAIAVTIVLTDQNEHGSVHLSDIAWR